MNDNKLYEIVLKHVNALQDPIKQEAFLESVSLAEHVEPSAVGRILEDMALDTKVVIVNELVYAINDRSFGVGTFRVVRETFGFAEYVEGSMYISKEGFGDAIDGDTVLFEIKNSDKKFGEIVSVLKRGRNVLLGTLKRKANALYFIPYDSKILKRVDIDASDIDVEENDRIIGHIESVEDTIHVTIISRLGQADEPGMDVLSVLFVYGIDNDFDEDVISEAQRVPEIIDEADINGRRDHRNQNVITIDGEDAKDLDDAVYMETLNGGYRLYVHIADVAHYVQQGTAIDKSAYKRSSSVYMVDRVVPMLPKVLSNGICSLHPNVDRLVLTCQMDISYSGEIIDYNIYESVIQSKRRMSYKEVNSEPNLGDEDEMIRLMLDCAQRLKYKREQAGQIGFDTAESQFIIDHEGNVLDIFLRERGEAEEMIEAFMVVANEVVARHCRYQSIPVLYRVHEAPDKEKIQELSHTLRILGYRMRGSFEDIKPKQIQHALEFFKDKPEYPVVSRLMLRSMTKAKYAPEPVGHFGLALQDYTHFTSPIRRYPDLLLHQRLKTYAFNHNFKNLERDELFASEAGVHVSKKERTILEAERQVEKMKKTQFMVDRVGEEYIGFISGISNFGIFVELDNTVEGLVHVRSLKDDFYSFDGPSQKLMGERTGRVYSIGQKLKVKVSGVDLLEHVVQLEIVGQKTIQARKSRKPSSQGRRVQIKSESPVKSDRSRKKNKKGVKIHEHRRKKS